MIPLAAIALIGGGAVAVPQPKLQVVAPLELEGGDAVVVDDDWEIDCRQLAATSYCDATLVSQIYGAGVVRIRASQADAVLSEATLDGRSIASSVEERGPGPVAVTLTEGAHDLRLRLRVAPSQEVPTRWVFPACEARHLVLHRGRPEARRTLAVALPAEERRADGYRFAVLVRPPPEMGFVAVREPDDPAWSELEGGARRLVLDSAPASIAARRMFSFTDPGQVFHYGGVMLGVGGRLSDGGAFRMRFEYEVGFAEFILPGLSIDGDVGRGWVLAPRVEVASPVILFIPSFSAGVGMPVHLGPDPDLGVRLIASAALGPVGVVATFDLYPQSEGLLFEPTVMLRLSM